MKVNLVPLTTEEMRAIQSSVVDRMIELNRVMQQSTDPEVKKTITSLGKISTKISNYDRPVK